MRSWKKKKKMLARCVHFSLTHVHVVVYTCPYSTLERMAYMFVKTKQKNLLYKKKKKNTDKQ